MQRSWVRSSLEAFPLFPNIYGARPRSTARGRDRELGARSRRPRCRPRHVHTRAARELTGGGRRVGDRGVGIENPADLRLRSCRRVNGDLAGERDPEAEMLAHERRSGVARRRNPAMGRAARRRPRPPRPVVRARRARDARASPRATSRGRLRVRRSRAARSRRRARRGGFRRPGRLRLGTEAASRRRRQRSAAARRPDDPRLGARARRRRAMARAARTMRGRSGGSVGVSVCSARRDGARCCPWPMLSRPASPCATTWRGRGRSRRSRPAVGAPPLCARASSSGVSFAHRGVSRRLFRRNRRRAPARVCFPWPVYMRVSRSLARAPWRRAARKLAARTGPGMCGGQVPIY